MKHRLRQGDSAKLPMKLLYLYVKIMPITFIITQRNLKRRKSKQFQGTLCGSNSLHSKFLKVLLTIFFFTDTVPWESGFNENFDNIRSLYFL